MLTLDLLSRKCSNYWLSILLFGLPFIVVYRGIDYLVFRVSTHGSEFGYPWRSTVKWDVLLVFLVSFIWWALMRQLQTWKQKYQAIGEGPNSRSGSHEHNGGSHS